jgi:uncharacterized C2H2 Zn-finger protein
MIYEEEYVCPKCGLVCGSLTEFHRHVKKDHPLTEEDT